MTLMLYKIPEAPNSLRICKRRFEHRHRLEEYRIERYITFDDAVLNYRGDNFYKKLLTTKKFWGFQVNDGPIYIHPDGYFKDISRIERKKINQKFLQSQHPPQWH